MPEVPATPDVESERSESDVVQPADPEIDPSDSEPNAFDDDFGTDASDDETPDGDAFDIFDEPTGDDESFDFNWVWKRIDLVVSPGSKDK